MEDQELESQEEVKDSGEVEETTEESTETAAVEGSEEATTEGPATEEEAGTETEGETEEAFVADFKYRANNEDREFDDFLREVATNKEQEDHLRQLHEKAAGLETVKAAFTEHEKKFDTLQGEFTKSNEGINALNSMVQSDRWEDFFQALQIPKEKIYRWVETQVNYHQATPEEKAQLDSQRAAQTSAFQSQGELEVLRGQIAEQRVTSQRSEMGLALLNPTTKAFADAYDGGIGKPGSFEKVVSDVRDLAQLKQGKTITAQQAVDQAMSLLQPQTGSSTTPVAASGQQAPPTTPRAKVIPNVQGRGASPISGRKYNNLDDLRARHTEMLGESE